MDDCGCGCSGTPSASRACRVDCQTPGNCLAQHFEDFPDLSGVVSRWQDDFDNNPLFSNGGLLVEGVCRSGQRFLARTDHYVFEGYLFTSAGAFLAFGSHGDVEGGTCSGAYFPEPPQCEGGTVTRVWVQDAITPMKVGDPVTLP